MLLKLKCRIWGETHWLSGPSAHAVSCAEVTQSKGEVISLWQCSSWRLGKKKKYTNRKRHPVQTVQKKEGLKRGKVPSHKKPDFNLWKNSTQHLGKFEVEMSQMTQLLSGRRPVRPDREKGLHGKERCFVIRLQTQERRKNWNKYVQNTDKYQEFMLIFSKSLGNKSHSLMADHFIVWSFFHYSLPS